MAEYPANSSNAARKRFSLLQFGASNKKGKGNAPASFVSSEVKDVRSLESAYTASSESSSVTDGQGSVESAHTEPIKAMKRSISKEKLKVLRKPRKLSKLFEEVPDSLTFLKERPISASKANSVEPLKQPASSSVLQATFSTSSVASSEDVASTSRGAPQLPELPPSSIAGTEDLGSSDLSGSSLTTQDRLSAGDTSNRDQADNSSSENGRVRSMRRKSLNMGSAGAARAWSAPSLSRAMSVSTDQPARRRKHQISGDVQRTILNEDETLSSDAFKSRYDENFSDRNLMTERRRAANVRRARKMTQLFGDEPPSELIKILESNDNRLIRSHDRDSIATLISVSSLQLLSSLANETRSTSPTPSNSDADSNPITPPQPDALGFDTQEEPYSSPEHFRERRRRAAKLSRFFGVGLQDLSPGLMDYSPLDAPDTQGVKVDVALAPARRLWGLVDGPRKEHDMSDVIDQLRGLKASG